jgi:Protein of unknown function (DUF1194)
VRSWRIPPLVFGLVLGVAMHAAAEDLPVDVELILAVDISGSVDEVEARQQREGYIAAIADPTVIHAIESTQYGRVALAYIEWAGAGQQRTLIDWTLIDSAAAAVAFADALAEAPRIRAMWTSISSGIDYAMPMFDGNGYEGTRRVIDISGDGPNNRGRPVTEARDEAVANGVIINGLPIMNDRPQPWTLPTPNEFGLDRYYIDNVIGGPGAFIVAAESFDEFKTAILTKLIREIAGFDGPTAVRIATR